MAFLSLISHKSDAIIGVKELIPMTLSKRVKFLMDDRNIGNKELSDRSGVPLRTINNIVSGVTENPTLETIRAIARALNCTLDDFADSISDYRQADELAEYLDILHKRPEMKMLFKVAKGATKEEVEKAAKIIEMFKEKLSGKDDI
jgi:transcriptional regulator with XRE-family HTH domain